MTSRHKEWTETILIQFWTILKWELEWPPGPGDSPTAATAMSVWYLVPWTSLDQWWLIFSLKIGTAEVLNWRSIIHLLTLIYPLLMASHRYEWIFLYKWWERLENWNHDERTMDHQLASIQVTFHPQQTKRIKDVGPVCFDLIHFYHFSLHLHLCTYIYYCQSWKPKIVHGKFRKWHEESMINGWVSAGFSMARQDAA